MNTTLQIRIDKKTKDDAQKAFHAMGLDMTSGVKLYLTQVATEQAIPFRVMSADGWSLKKKQLLIRDAEDALKNGKSYKTIREAHRDTLGT